METSTLYRNRWTFCRREHAAGQTVSGLHNASTSRYTAVFLRLLVIPSPSTSMVARSLQTTLLLAITRRCFGNRSDNHAAEASKAGLDEQRQFFDSIVRPVRVEHCYECHFPQQTHWKWTCDCSRQRRFQPIDQGLTIQG